MRGRMRHKATDQSKSELGERIGRNIKLARARKGITQSQLAEALEIDSVTVSRIETGAQLPSIERIDQIANVLGMSLGSLVSDTSKSSAFAEMIAETTKGLPARERDFIFSFVVSYAQHWRSNK